MNGTRCIVLPFLLMLVVLSGTPDARGQVAQLDQGVTLRIFKVERDLKALPTLAANQTPNVDELRTAIDYRGAEGFAHVEASIYCTVTGWIEVPMGQAGAHRFRLTSDDGSRLTLDGRMLIDNDGPHGALAMTSAAIELAAGKHDLLIEHFDRGGKRQLTLEWLTPGTIEYEVLPMKALWTERDLTRVTAPGFKQLADDRRPGDGTPVGGVHPAWDLSTIRPEGFEPMVGAMTFLPDGRLVVGTFFPLQRDERVLPDIESKVPDKLYALSDVTSGEASPVEAVVIAEGFYEPMGLCVVDGVLYVSHRREITKLFDTDDDGFFETHELVASGWEGWNYHQFTRGLVHKAGKLYASLSTAMAPPAWEGMETNSGPNGPMRGGVLEIDLSSGDVRVIAGGCRTPNGLGLGPEGSLFYLDNQGTWMPTSQLTEVIPGRFFGHYNWTRFVTKLAERFPDGGHPSVYSDRPRTPASVLLPHNELANSPTQPLLIEEGDFAGQMLIGELTAGGIRRVFLERINGQWQGAVFRFTQGFESGVNRLIQGPDGALYIGGIGAGGNWNWQGTKFGLQRLAPNGRTVFEIHSMKAVPGGFDLRFTKPVDRAWLNDAGHFIVKQWTYEPTAAYGGPKMGTEVLLVREAHVSSDGRGVRLLIDGLKAGHCVHVRTDPTSTTGERLWSTEAWYTLNEMPREEPPKRATIAGKLIDPEAHGIGVGVLPPANAAPLITKSASNVMHFANAGTPAMVLQDELIAIGDGQGVAVGMGSGDLISNTSFGDARLHVEWYSPPGGEGQMAGNSGVYLHERYEIQVLGTRQGVEPRINEAGAIYNVKAADVNASNGPGAWQAYDIWFRAPRFKAGIKTQDARVTVYWNGQLVHNDIAVPKPTGSAAEGGETSDRTVQIGKLRLQDHGSDAEGPVRYRNLWIAPLEEIEYAEGPWQNLFGDEEDAEWVVRGGQASYRFEDGVLIGETRPDTPNTFYTSPRTFGDFELLYDAKQHIELNSGVQIRSFVQGGIDNREGGLQGYQIELDPTPRAFSAGIYEERGRGWLHPLHAAPYARRAYRVGEWNHFRIVAKGALIQTWVNGVPAATMFDDMASEGLIAFQVHGVGALKEPLEVRFRNVRIRELSRVD